MAVIIVSLMHGHTNIKPQSYILRISLSALTLLLELKLHDVVKDSRVTITLVICNKSPFIMECYVGHVPLFKIYVVDTAF